MEGRGGLYKEEKKVRGSDVKSKRGETLKGWKEDHILCVCVGL